MSLYNEDGSIAVTRVDGATLVGVQAPDGSINIIVDDDTHYGIYHPSGAIRVNSTLGNTVLDPSGAYYINKLFGERGTPSKVPFLPSDIEPILWIEPQQGGLFQSNLGTTPAESDGDTVGYLTDLSGNGNHYTSVADDTTRPTLQGLSSFPCIRFDGVNDFVRRTSSLGLLAGGAYTLAFVLKGNSSAADSRVFAEGNSVNNNTLFIAVQAGSTDATTSSSLYRNDAGLQLVSPTFTTNAGVFDGDSHVLVITDDGEFVRTYVDGTTGASTGWTPSGTFTLDRSSIGCLLRAVSGNWWAGDIYGIIITDKVITEAQRQGMTKYLGNLAGLSL